jgi:hypothetical protein
MRGRVGQRKIGEWPGWVESRRWTNMATRRPGADFSKSSPCAHASPSGQPTATGHDGMITMQYRSGALAVLLTLVLLACSNEPTLPGGYAISFGDRGKTRLQNPDGTLAHGAIVKRLHTDGRDILLISFAATSAGEVVGPRPLDGNCFIALLIDSKEQQVRQVRLDEASRLASRMALVDSSNLGCLEGMPVA